VHVVDVDHRLHPTATQACQTNKQCEEVKDDLPPAAVIAQGFPFMDGIGNEHKDLSSSKTPYFHLQKIKTSMTRPTNAVIYFCCIFFIYLCFFKTLQSFFALV